MGNNYENMTKEELITKIKCMEIEMESLKSFDKRVVDQNNRFHDLLKSIQFLLKQSYDNIRDN